MSGAEENVIQENRTGEGSLSNVFPDSFLVNSPHEFFGLSVESV